MALLGFHATCKQAHTEGGRRLDQRAATNLSKCGVAVLRCDFETTDRAEFERHMADAHGRKMGTRKGAAETKPYPWKAPSAPKDTTKLTAVLSKAGPDVTDWSTDDVVPPSELREGDAFLFGVRTYDVLEVNGDSLRLRIRAAGKSHPEREGTLKLEQIEQKAPTVSLVKRAA